MDNTTTNDQVQAQEEIVSRPNHLKLVALNVNEFAGLNYEDKALVIHFPQHENGETGGIIEFSGDQGVGKTSIMNGIKFLMGENEPANAINSKSKTKGLSLTFQKGEDVYTSRATTKSFVLTLNKEIEGKVVGSDLKRPKDILTSLIGPLGLSPDFLSKKKSGEDQIDWIKSLSSPNSEVSKIEREANENYANAYKERTGVNATASRLTQEIASAGYYQIEKESGTLSETEKFKQDNEKVQRAPANKEELNDLFQKALADNQQLDKANEWLDRSVGVMSVLEIEQKSIEDKILMLQQDLKEKQSQIESLTINIAKANSKKEELKDAPDNYRVANENMQNASTVALVKRDIEQAKNNAVLLGQVLETQLTLNNKMVEIDKIRKEIAKSFTPDIEGMEVEIGGSIDEATRPIGVYLHGVNMSHLSESELWDLCLQVWKVSGTSIVFIENSTSLGTDAINRIKWFADNGGYVFLSTMTRGYKTLKVEFLKELK